MPKMTFVGYQS